MSNAECLTMPFSMLQRSCCKSGKVAYHEVAGPLSTLVERRCRWSPATAGEHEMELRGTLRDFSLEAILGLIRNGHKTGTLHLVVTTPLGMTRRIDLSFLDGEIASVRCGSPSWARCPARGSNMCRKGHSNSASTARSPLRTRPSRLPWKWRWRPSTRHATR